MSDENISSVATPDFGQVIRWPRGSEWRKWDLHFHTPSSYEYSNKGLSSEDLVAALKAAGIAVVAITDHHLIDVERVKRLQSLAGNDLTVLPGIELRTELGGSESVHIIAIFPDELDLGHIWTILQGKLDLTESAVKEKGNDKIYVDFKDAAELIHDLGGLVSVHAGKKSNSIESISNAQAFKHAVKEDLAETCIDMLELGRPSDAEDYENVVFPKIGRQFPMVICSDNHNAKEYKLKIPNWIRADPTFKGFRQILTEPTGRVYRGDLPPILKRVAENKTKYINKVTIRKVPGSTLGEEWFDCEILLNPGLIAIIGNKGSGKSALTDAVGLVGQTRNGSSFSFLSTSKFRKQKDNKAQHFRATLSWESGPDVDRILDEDVDPTAVETVKYIPQNHLETICNELRGGGDSRFDHELKSVIFSHVGDPGNLDFQSLDDLIQYKTTETYTAIELLRSELRKINEQIVAFEQMLLPGYKKSLEALEAEKKKELEALEAAKPAIVNKPELDPAKQAEMAALTEQIGNLQTELANLEGQRDKLLDERKQVTRRSTVATKLLSKIENFKKQHQMFLNDSRSDFGELGISPEQAVQVLINTSSITAVKRDADARVAEIAGALNSSMAGSVGFGILNLKATLTSSSSQLDAPNKEYQDFLAALTNWNEGKAAIFGDETTVGTYKNLQARIKDLDEIPAELTKAKNRRTEKANEIYGRIADSDEGGH